MVLALTAQRVVESGVVRHPTRMGRVSTNRITEFRTEAPARAGDSSRVPPLWLRVGFYACIVIAVAAVLRRVFVLIRLAQPAAPQLAALDKTFSSHAALTLAHILPALAFVLVVPFFVFRKSNDTRWAEHVLLPLGLVVGITAYAMSTYSVGGWVERSAVLVFNTLFVFSLFRSYLYMRRGDMLLTCS
jgi:hypothetical protein